MRPASDLCPRPCLGSSGSCSASRPTKDHPSYDGVVGADGADAGVVGEHTESDDTLALEHAVCGRGGRSTLSALFCRDG